MTAGLTPHRVALPRLVALRKPLAMLLLAVTLDACSPRATLTPTPEDRGFVPPGGIKSPNGDRVYLHEDVKSQTDMPRVWELIVFGKPREGAWEMLSLLEGRCREAQVCVLSVAFYGRRGEVILQQNHDPPDCSHVAPGTVNEARYRGLCRGD